VNPIRAMIGQIHGPLSIVSRAHNTNRVNSLDRDSTINGDSGQSFTRCRPRDEASPGPVTDRDIPTI
jgi:hypothetical protein